MSKCHIVGNLMQWLKLFFRKPIQGRSQNAVIVTHIKERLLKRALIFISCVPFQKRTSQRERILYFKSSPFGMKKDYFYFIWPRREKTCLRGLRTFFNTGMMQINRIRIGEEYR